MIYWRVLVRDNHDHDAGIKDMTNVFYQHKLWKIKIILLQSSCNFTLKPELEPKRTVIACLAGGDAQEVLYTGFVQTWSSNCDSCQTSAVPIFTRALVIIVLLEEF